VALLALIAGTVSYLHMHLLVELHGQPGWVAALTPLSAIDRTQPGHQAVNGRDDRGGGLLERLIGPLRQARGIPPQSAHRWPCGRSVDLDQDAAALLERELDDTFHRIHHPEHPVTSTVMLWSTVVKRSRCLQCRRRPWDAQNSRQTHIRRRGIGV